MESQQLQGEVPPFKNLDVAAPQNLDPSQQEFEFSENYKGKYGTQQILMVPNFNGGS